MAAAFFAFWLISPIASADIYKYVDESGTICYTDAPTEKKPDQVIREKTEKTQRSFQKTALISGRDYSPYVHKAAAKYDLEPELIKAVIKTESNGDHRAVSKKGAMGLMQLMPSTANDLNVSNPFNPEENIEGGVRYLKQLIERFDGNLTLALAAYNSGPKTVERYGSVPPIQETRQYVQRIYTLYNGRKNYAFSDMAGSSRGSQGPIYKIVLDDGTILFTNATLEKNSKTRL